jgi:hypothetical protein
MEQKIEVLSDVAKDVKLTRKKVLKCKYYLSVFIILAPSKPFEKKLTSNKSKKNFFVNIYFYKVGAEENYQIAKETSAGLEVICVKILTVKFSNFIF